MTGIGGGSMSMSSSSPYPDMSDYASSSSMAFGEGSGLGASGISGVFTSSASSLAPSASAADPRLSKQVGEGLDFETLGEGIVIYVCLCKTHPYCILRTVKCMGKI